MKFSDTITVYTVIPQQGRTPERLQKTIVKGVFWDRTFGAEYSKKGENERDSVTVMIPDLGATLASPDLPKLKAGDIILRGEHGEATTAAEACGFTEEHFVITSVRDCRYGSRHMWHWEVSGK